MEIFGVAVVVALALCVSFAKAAARADREDDATAERLAMQQEAFRWPKRVDS